MLQNVDQLWLLKPLFAVISRLVLVLRASVNVHERSSIVVRWSSGDSRDWDGTAAYLALRSVSSPWELQYRARRSEYNILHFSTSSFELSKLSYHTYSDTLCAIDIYTCHACGCTYGFAPGTMPLPATRATREREMLLELSRILHSVIDGGAGVTLEDILCDISRIVPLGNGMGNDHVYEYVHPSWMFSDKNLSISPPSYVKSQVPSRRTLADPKLCIAPRYSYEYNYARSVPFPKNDAEEVTKCERNKKSSSHAEEESCDKANNSHCKYLHENNGAKQSLEPDRDSKRCRDDRASSESIHPMVSQRWNNLFSLL